jgi:DNA-binding response OmpR family regulator
VVLLDVNLPGIDGFGLVERIWRASRVPVVMLTVRHEEPDIVRAEMGADASALSPFSPLSDSSCCETT